MSGIKKFFQWSDTIILTIIIKKCTQKCAPNKLADYCTQWVPGWLASNYDPAPWYYSCVILKEAGLSTMHVIYIFDITGCDISGNHVNFSSIIYMKTYLCLSLSDSKALKRLNPILRMILPHNTTRTKLHCSAYPIKLQIWSMYQ